MIFFHTRRTLKPVSGCKKFELGVWLRKVRLVFVINLFALSLASSFAKGAPLAKTVQETPTQQPGFSWDFLADLTGFVDDAWTYYHPTAFTTNMAANRHFYIDFSLYPKDVGHADFQENYARIEYASSIFQLGVNTRSQPDNPLPSAYFNSKINIVNEENSHLPIFLALGFKQRLYYNNTKTKQFYYPKDSHQGQVDKDWDQRSLYLAFDFRLDKFGVVASSYYDNLYTGADLKWYLRSRLAFLFSGWVTRTPATGYQETENDLPYTSPDYMVGLEYLTSEYFNINLTYSRMFQRGGLGMKIAF